MVDAMDLPGCGMDGLVKLEIPDLPPDFFCDSPGGLGDFAMAPPPAFAGMPTGIWQLLCQRMMTDIHRNHSMSDQEKEESLRSIVVPIPGDPPGRQITLLEDPKGVFASGGTGSVLWPASVGLIQYLDREVPVVTDADRPASRRPCAVELGAGLGAVGIFLAQHKGLRAVLTEVPEAFPLLARNVAEFGPEDLLGLADVAPLRWGDSVQTSVLGKFDLVLGSDITYRPDCLADLLATAAALVALPGELGEGSEGGRVLLTLQDRPGEAAQLERACLAGPLEVVRREEMSVEGFPEMGDGEGPHRVLLFELALKGHPPSPKSATFPGGHTLDEVEAHFERVTGIRPDKLLPEGFRRTGVESPGKAGGGKENAKQGSTKDRFVKEMLDRGLGDYLCQQDEDLSAKIDAQDPDSRPRTTAQKQLFAEAFYAGREPPPEAFPASGRGSASMGADCDAMEQAALAAAGAAARQPGQKAAASASSAGAARRAAAGADGAAVARMCMPGLEWEVEMHEAESAMTAFVTFGEEVWKGLQGSRPGGTGSSAFREAVDFQLSDLELRVLHAGAPVLELELPRGVNAAAATAKICSKRRRVTVRAPLR